MAGWIIRAMDSGDGHVIWRRMDPPAWVTVPSGATVFETQHEAEIAAQEVPELDLENITVEAAQPSE